MRKHVLFTLVLSLVFILAPMSASAAECEGVSYDDQIEVNGTQLELNGLGIREATVFQVDVYVAALYLENTSNDGAAIARSEETKRLILHFVRDVEAGDISEAWSEGFEKNAGRALSGLEDRINTLNGWMADMAIGDLMVFTYVPGTGLTVEVDGDVKGTIEGDDFARVFFLIWLGSDPPNSGLRTGLLGGTCG